MRAISVAAALVLTAQVATPVAGVAQEFSGVEQEVWSMEESYWQRVAAGDVRAYLDLWDEAFVG